MLLPLRFLPWVTAALLAVLGSGCASFGDRSLVPASNPLLVRAQSLEAAWEPVIDVLHARHFEIEEEDRLNGRIVTRYWTGSGLLEPWHRDSVDFEERLESSLQSIRRKVMVHFTPADGGYLVGVDVVKEVEDIRGPVANSPGTATFQESTPLERDLNVVVGEAVPSGWIPIGRDHKLEASLMRELRSTYERRR